MSFIDGEAILQIAGAFVTLVTLIKGKKYVDDKAATASAVFDRARVLVRAAARPYLPLVNVWPEEKIRAALFLAIDKIAGVLRISLTAAQRVELEQLMEVEILTATFERLGEQLREQAAKDAARPSPV